MDAAWMNSAAQKTLSDAYKRCETYAYLLCENAANIPAKYENLNEAEIWSEAASTHGTKRTRTQDSDINNSNLVFAVQDIRQRCAECHKFL